MPQVVVAGEEWVRLPVSAAGPLTPARVSAIVSELVTATGLSASELFDLGASSITPKNWFGTVTVQDVTLEVVPKGASSLDLQGRERLDANLASIVEEALVGDVRPAGEAYLAFAESHLDRAVETMVGLLFAARRRHVMRRYVMREEETVVPRGALRFPEQAFISIERPGVFASRWPELVEDTPVLRYMKAVLRLVRPLVGQLVQPAVDLALVDLDGVGESLPVNPGQQATARLGGEYLQALEIADEIVQGRGRGFLAGGSFGATDVVIAPPVWEAFVGAAVGRAADRVGLRRIPKSGGRHLGTWVTGSAVGGNFVEAIPDVEVADADGSVQLIVDAKWKQLRLARPSLGVDASDVHQLVAYALRFGCKKVALAYPVMTPDLLEPMPAAAIPSPDGELRLAVLGIPLLWSEWQGVEADLAMRIEALVSAS